MVVADLREQVEKENVEKGAENDNQWNDDTGDLPRRVHDYRNDDVHQEGEANQQAILH